MFLRKLELKDASYMLEWMHDKSVTQYLATNFKQFTLLDCENFILKSLNESNDLHMAIVSNNDEYMGTVSLKNINYERRFAEFAITIRKKAMGMGYASFAMAEIFKLASKHLKLDNIYWCVSEKNDRACRFYEKNHFEHTLFVPNQIISNYKNNTGLIWYIKKLKVDRDEDHSNIDGVKFININTIKSKADGQLSYFESMRDIPFEIKRIYYITNVSKFMTRGFHAHKKLKQIIFCPYGEIKLILDDGYKKQEYLLNSPSIGVMIDKPIWREIIWEIDNSVLMVAASDYYSESDYLRDYNDFLNYLKIN